MEGHRYIYYGHCLLTHHRSKTMRIFSKKNAYHSYSDTGTYLNEGGLAPTRLLKHAHPCIAVWYYLKATVAIFGSVCYWVGSWNLLDYYLLPPESESRDTVLVLVGLGKQ